MMAEYNAKNGAVAGLADQGPGRRAAEFNDEIYDSFGDRGERSVRGSSPHSDLAKQDLRQLREGAQRSRRLGEDLRRCLCAPAQPRSRPVD